MKIQLTSLAAAIALAASAGAMALGPQASQNHDGGNTNPSVTFQQSRNAIDGMAGFNGNPGDGSESIIYQNGNHNNATVTQHGDQWSRIQQDGNRHEATVSQRGSSQNESTIYQRGNSHSSLWDGNTASVIQNGNLNDSYVFQDGKYNNADLTQYGDLNDSYINQRGGWNTADVYQNGTELDSDIFQEGSKNYADINQYGFGHDSYVHQTGTGILTENRATVSQHGQDQHFSQVIQNGRGNTASVSQYQ